MQEQVPGSTRTRMVMDTIRRRIAGRSLTPGARLPSIRMLASTLSVSPSTVVEAYERLVAEGAIHSRPGSGFYVAGQAAPVLGLVTTTYLYGAVLVVLALISLSAMAAANRPRRTVALG